MIFGRKALNEAAGSWTNSWRIFRNLLITREPALLSWSSVCESCCRVKECSSCCTICSVTAGPVCTFRLSNSVKRKPRITSVVPVTGTEPLWQCKPFYNWVSKVVSWLLWFCIAKLWVLIDSLDCLRLLWLTRVIFILVLRHSIRKPPSLIHEFYDVTIQMKPLYRGWQL